MLLAALTLLAQPSFAQDDPTDPRLPTGPNAALFEAAMEGSLDDIRAAIEAGADPNWFNDYGTTPLMLAAASTTDPAVVEYMIDEAGAVVADWDAVRMSALHHALVAGTANDAVVRALISRYDPDLASKRGTFAVDVAMQNPVMVAARAGRSIEILDAIMTVDPPADINAVSSEGYTVLMQCAGMPGRAAQIRWLLDHGADLNARNTSERMSTCCGYNRTAVFYAAMNGSPDNLHALIFDHIHPIHDTVQYRRFDPAFRDDTDRTALSYAEENEALRGSEALELLRAAAREPAEQENEVELPTWVTQMFGEDFFERLETDAPNQSLLTLISELRTVPEFKDILAELPETNRAYFADYFAWQIDQYFMRRQSAARRHLEEDGFIHTIMNDLARVRLIPEDEIAIWRRERERQYDRLLNPVRDELQRVLADRALPDEMVDAVMDTFELRVAATKRWLTNPACAACDRPSGPDDLQLMLAYRFQQLETVVKQVDQHHPRLAEAPDALQRSLMISAAALQREVTNGYLNRIGWTPDVAEGDPRPGRPVVLGPIDEGRISRWRPSSRVIASDRVHRNRGEPLVSMMLRYEPAEPPAEPED